MFIQPYVWFDGRCEEAVTFYNGAIGAEIQMLMRQGETPDGTGRMPPGAENKILHVTFRVGDSLIMASDGQCGGNPTFKGISLALSVADTPAAERAFAALGSGGKVEMPLTKTFFSPSFGIVVDRFGVTWMVSVAQAPADSSHS
jgi:PhnB protein